MNIVFHDVKILSGYTNDAGERFTKHLCYIYKDLMRDSFIIFNMTTYRKKSLYQDYVRNCDGNPICFMHNGEPRTISSRVTILSSKEYYSLYKGSVSGRQYQIRLIEEILNSFSKFTRWTFNVVGEVIINNLEMRKSIQDYKNI